MTTNLQVFDASLSLGNLETYISHVQAMPMLSAAEEMDLARRFTETQDLAAARQLVLSHLKFVVKIARGYAGYGLAQADLIQEGNIGLMKAVKRFNPLIGVRLVTFAVHWIRAEIHEFIIRNWRIVKIATTKAQRKLFFNLRSAKKHLGWFTQAEVNEVAAELKVTPAEVMAMEARLSAHDIALDLSDDDNDEQTAPITYLESPQSDPAYQLEHADWSGQHQDKLKLALQNLDERSKDILMQRWLHAEKATLHDLAAKYKVSAERIRQLEQTAIAKLKEAIS